MINDGMRIDPVRGKCRIRRWICAMLPHRTAQVIDVRVVGMIGDELARHLRQPDRQQRMVPARQRPGKSAENFLNRSGALMLINAAKACGWQITWFNTTAPPVENPAATTRWRQLRGWYGAFDRGVPFWRHRAVPDQAPRCHGRHARCIDTVAFV